jgi:hypothetical protein
VPEYVRMLENDSASVSSNVQILRNDNHCDKDHVDPSRVYLQ